MNKIADLRTVDLDPFDGTCCSMGLAIVLPESLAECKSCGTMWARDKEWPKGRKWRRWEYRFCGRVGSCPHSQPVVKNPSRCWGCPEAEVEKYPQRVDISMMLR